MSVQIVNHRIRLQCDARYWEDLTDKITGAIPKIPRGVDVDVEVGLYEYGVFVDSVANIATVTLELLATLDAAPLVTKTLTVGELDAGLTADEWLTNAANQRHGCFVLSRTDTQLDMTDSSNNAKSFWLVVHAVLTTGEYLTLCRTQLRVIEDGVQNGLPCVSLNNNTRISPTTGLTQIYVEGTGKWHTLIGTYLAGVAGWALDQTGED